MEQYKYDGTLIIVGPSGSGKTTLGEELEAILGLPIYPAGNVFRDECIALGIDISELPKVDKVKKLQLDQRTDEHTLAIIGQNVIITARTAAMFANKMIMDGTLQKQKCKSVGINCGLKVRALRRHGSQVRDVMANGGDISQVPTVEKIGEGLVARDTGDLDRLRYLYGESYGLAGYYGLYGAPPCDLVLNSERMSIAQEVQQVVALLGFINVTT